MNTSQATTAQSPTPSLEAPGPSSSSVILACEMIDDEVQLVLERVAEQAGSFPLVWIESGLHDRPEKLRDHIQSLLDLLDAAALTGEPAVLPSVEPGRGPGAERSTEVTVPPVDDVLLALGYCGNGLQGLVSRTARLVFPRVDDCISLFLNHGCCRAEIKRDAHAFYLTKGWLAHNNAFLDSHNEWVERYGPEKAHYLRKASLAAYQRFTLIDTGAYDVTTQVPTVQKMADDLELEQTLVPGSLQLLERLVAGPWDSEVVVVPPGEAITIFHLFGQD